MMKKLFKDMRLPKGKAGWSNLTKGQMKTIAILGSILLVLILWCLSWVSSDQNQPIQKSLEEAPKMVKVSSHIDPRDMWTRDVQTSFKDFQGEVSKLIQEERQHHEKSFADLRQELTETKQAPPIPTVRIVEPSADKPHEPNPSTSPNPAIKEHPKPKLGYLKNTALKVRGLTKTSEKYVASGSFARAVLLTGVVAETGTESQTSPQPILMRLVDHGIFSKGYRTEAIKDAVIIGSCYGVLASERALCRLESVSLTDTKDQIIERPLEGWVIGEDGRPGLKGEVVDKASDVARMAILNGILGGIAGFFQNQAQASTFPVSPISGASHALKGTDALKAGGASGIGSALTKLADYAIKRAEQMNPVILIGAGRQVDVVFKRGFQIEDAPALDGIKAEVKETSQMNIQEQQALAKSGLKQAEDFQVVNLSTKGMANNGLSNNGLGSM